jgi:hypothetical protein
VFKDSKSKTLNRFSVPGLLSASGNTLISANQLKRQDGIGYAVPGDESPSSLYTGNPRNPTREIVLDTMFNGLDCLTPLSESAVKHLVDSGYAMRDFTSSPIDATDGNTRCMQILDYQSELIFYEPQLGLSASPTTADGTPSSSASAAASDAETRSTKAFTPAVKLLRRSAAAARGGNLAENELLNLNRLLPNKVKQAIKIHTLGGHGSEGTTRNFLDRTTGHGFTDENRKLFGKLLPYCTTCRQANMQPPKPQKKNPRPRLTAQQLHDAGVVQKPWIRNAPMNTK